MNLRDKISAHEGLLFPLVFLFACATTWFAIQAIISADLSISEELSQSDVLAVMFLTKIGFAVDCLTILVTMLCIKLYFRKPDMAALKFAAKTEKYGYDYCDDALAERGSTESYLVVAKAVHWLAWKRALCSMYPQFWAVFWFIMYAGAISMVSLYLYSIHPPCEARHDCQQTEATGIYTGKQNQ